MCIRVLETIGTNVFVVDEMNGFEVKDSGQCTREAVGYDFS